MTCCPSFIDYLTKYEKKKFFNEWKCAANGNCTYIHGRPYWTSSSTRSPKNCMKKSKNVCHPNKKFFFFEKWSVDERYIRGKISVNRLHTNQQPIYLNRSLFIYMWKLLKREFFFCHQQTLLMTLSMFSKWCILLTLHTFFVSNKRDRRW